MRRRGASRLVAAALAGVASAWLPGAAAIDESVVHGTLVCDGKAIPLAHAQAVTAPGDLSTIWVWITDAAVAVEEARSPDAVLARARRGELRGVRFEVGSPTPDASIVAGTLYPGALPMEPKAIDEPGAAWDQLVVGERRVVGQLQLPHPAPGPEGCAAWALDLNFSVPILRGSRLAQ